jgi:hypothetical protein
MLMTHKLEPNNLDLCYTRDNFAAGTPVESCIVADGPAIAPIALVPAPAVRERLSTHPGRRVVGLSRLSWFGHALFLEVALRRVAAYSYLDASCIAAGGSTIAPRLSWSLFQDLFGGEVGSFRTTMSSLTQSSRQLRLNYKVFKGKGVQTLSSCKCAFASLFLHPSYNLRIKPAARKRQKTMSRVPHWR